jgi:hypothetical protein
MVELLWLALRVEAKISNIVSYPCNKSNELDAWTNDAGA